MHNFERIHFIGIGGIGMSALARLCLHEGKIVSGSDRSPSDITRALEAEGATVFTEQVGTNVHDDVELIVYSGAVKEDNPERIEAARLGIPGMNYFEALASVVNTYKLVAISGSHGKTTTTAMIADIFERAGKDPTVIVGSLRAKTKSNFRAGKSEWAVVEACEYRRHFHNLDPFVLVITNIEYEHVDYYTSLEDVQDAFRTMARKVPHEGFVICDTADKNLAPVIADLQATVVDYRVFFDPLMPLAQPGIHNRLNAAAASAAAVSVGIDASVAKEALADFKGTWRRFEYKGTVNGAPLYDDYGHHPSEIRATLQGARDAHPGKELLVVFQPHTYTRANELFDGFVAELAKAEHVVLLPIYAAREENVSGVSSEQIVARITGAGGDAVSLSRIDEAVRYVQERAGEHMVVVVMGAGDITEVATGLTKS